MERPRRVLIIEDDDDVAQSLKALIELERDDLSVAVATDYATGKKRALTIRPI